MFILLLIVIYRWWLLSSIWCRPADLNTNCEIMFHYTDVIMTTMASPITSLTVVYSTVYWDADQRKHQSSLHWPLCGEFTGTGEFPAQRPSYTENVSIWWRHHVSVIYTFTLAIWGNLGWGLLSEFLPFRYFLKFSALSKHTLAIEYHVNIWQVLPQLSCGDTCQIWMWFKESERNFCNIENFAYGEIDERSFSNPHPWTENYAVW